LDSAISKHAWDSAKKEQLNTEFSRLKQALDDALMRPKSLAFPETDIQGLAGNDESTNVWGAPKEAKIIAKAAMDTVQRF
jgi:hypothetical protein